MPAEALVSVRFSQVTKVYFLTAYRYADDLLCVVDGYPTLAAHRHHFRVARCRDRCKLQTLAGHFPGTIIASRGALRNVSFR